MVLVMGIAATTRAVLDLDLWRHSGQRARDIVARPAADPRDAQHALVAIQFDVFASLDVLLAAAERDDATGVQARALLENFRKRLR